MTVQVGDRFRSKSGCVYRVARLETEKDPWVITACNAGGWPNGKEWPMTRAAIERMTKLGAKDDDNS